MKTIVAFAIITCATLCLTGCVTVDIPSHEYNVAKASYDAAVTAEAAKFAPRSFYKAEKSFRKAEILYKQRYYDAARTEFQQAQKLAEKAETAAKIKQFNSGDLGDD